MINQIVKKESIDIKRQADRKQWHIFILLMIFEFLIAVVLIAILIIDFNF